ncbi:MAG: peptide ABC transporter substrate-binding protein [Bacillota bacterium]
MKSNQPKIRLLLVCIVATLFFFCGCEKTEQPEKIEITVEDEAPSEGGTMLMGSMEPKSLNPLITDSKSYMDITKLIFHGLAEYDESLKLQPVLAEGWSFENGSSECIVRLKDNLLWSDGKPITSSDVKYSLDTIKAAGASLYKSTLEHIYSYTVLDEKTISITFDQPFSNAIDMLCFPIIPEHIYSRNPDAVPVCSGPYKISSYDKLEFMELERNENWVGLSELQKNNQTKPYIEKIRIKFINDTEAFSTAFQSKELDILNTLSYDWEKYNELKDVSSYKYVSMYYDFIGLNHNSPVLKDKAVRKAMMLAINRKALVDKYLLGNAVLTDAPINPKSWLYDGTVTKAGYNISDAQSILKSAGFEDVDGDKILERIVEGTVQKLNITIITNEENDFRKNAIEDIRKNLSDAGFTVHVKLLSFDEMKIALETKQFEAVLTGYNLSPSQDLSFAFHTSQIEAGKNYYSYSNADMDSILYQTYTSMTDEARKEAYKKLQALFIEELPCISLFFREGAVVTRNKIKGDIKPSTVNPFDSIEKWFIAKNMR